MTNRMEGSGPVVVTRWPYMFSRKTPPASPSRLGSIRVLRYEPSMPRLDPGIGVVYAAARVDAIRIVTPADEARILAARQVIADAHAAAERVYAAAFRRGRQPTLAEIEEASA